MRAAARCLIAVSILLATPAFAGDLDRAMAVQRAEDIVWQDAAGFAGLQVAVVSGNPSKPGPYTVRVKFSPGAMSRPHWHPETRYITVLKGTWWVGAGERFDPDSTVPVPAGSFVTHFSHEVHYDGARDEEVIVQISGIGPSATNRVDTR